MSQGCPGPDSAHPRPSRLLGGFSLSHTFPTPAKPVSPVFSPTPPLLPCELVEGSLPLLVTYFTKKKTHSETKQLVHSRLSG